MKGREVPVGSFFPPIRNFCFTESLIVVDFGFKVCLIILSVIKE